MHEPWNRIGAKQRSAEQRRKATSLFPVFLSLFWREIKVLHGKVS